VQLTLGVDGNDQQRTYAVAEMRVRRHQRSFRERVLGAYRRQRAFCRLRHDELLDAAHVVPDAHGEGEPIVQNGLASCSLHHRAFDRDSMEVTCHAEFCAAVQCVGPYSLAKAISHRGRAAFAGAARSKSSPHWWAYLAPLSGTLLAWHRLYLGHRQIIDFGTDAPHEPFAKEGRKICTSAR
jgi:hypothetical protein